MARWVGLILLLALVLGAGVGSWWYSERVRLARREEIREIGQTTNFRYAQQRMARFEAPPDTEAKLATLVAAWGTGDHRFDLHLAKHIVDQKCSEHLRAAFSRSLSERPEQLARWAQFWSWRSRPSVAQEAERLLVTIETLVSPDDAPPIRWRQVLDLQAIWQLDGRTDLAVGLEPAIAKERMLAWHDGTEPAWNQLPRPTQPLPVVTVPVAGSNPTAP